MPPSEMPSNHIRVHPRARCRLHHGAAQRLGHAIFKVERQIRTRHDDIHRQPKRMHRGDHALLGEFPWPDPRPRQHDQQHIRLATRGRVMQTVDHLRRRAHRTSFIAGVLSTAPQMRLRKVPVATVSPISCSTGMREVDNNP